VFSPDDTIVAIATPPGRAGIGVIRISGPHATKIAAAVLTVHKPLQPRFATFTRARLERLPAPGADQSAGMVDEVVATFFPAPRSYTGQDVIEISGHGSPIVLRAIVEQALAVGARLAEPGEFTLRAFLNGKRDLIQAEAVADLIDAVTPLQARTAFDQLEGTLTSRIAVIDATLFDLIAKLEASLDFPDEGYHFIAPAAIASSIDGIVSESDTLLGDAGRGRMVREGAQVVIAGRPNVGKSSLFNALAGADRAIVTEVPGTTRDLVTEAVEIDGLAITLVDTAGVRDTLDVVEREGVARGDRARDVADLVLVVLDASEPLTQDDQRLIDRTVSSRRLIVANKSDVAMAQHEQQANSPRLVCDVSVSATTGAGLGSLRTAVARALTGSESRRDPPAISNVRHIALLQEARERLACAAESARAETPEEFVLADLQTARQRFEEIVGRRTAEDLLAHIFERFCIGK
jgi:tRNA modification GTPase